MEWPDQFTKAGCRVAVLSGGSSSERDVSLVSGKAVVDALKESGIPCEIFELKENSLPSELDPSVRDQGRHQKFLASLNNELCQFVPVDLNTVFLRPRGIAHRIQGQASDQQSHQKSDPA